MKKITILFMFTSLLIVLSCSENPVELSSVQRDSQEEPPPIQQASVETIIPVVNPSGVGINLNTNRIYVSGWTSSRLTVIDGSINQIVASTSTAWAGLGVDVNPNTNRIYVSGWSQLTVHDGVTNGIIANVPTSGPAGGTGAVAGPVVVNPNTNLIYVGAGHGGNNVLVIDGTTNLIIATISGFNGGSQRGMGINTTTNRIYVSRSITNEVKVIDGASNTVIATVAVGSGPFGIGVNPNTNRIYVTNNFSNNVSVIDGNTNTVISTIEVGNYPSGIGVNPNTNRVYVGNSAYNTVSFIDGATNTIIHTIDVGTAIQADGIEINPNTNYVYVACVGSNEVYVIKDDIITVIQVEVDVKPGSDPNSINLKSKGVIPVAILTTEDFDATTVNPLSVEFGPAGSMEAHNKGHIEDVDDDGDDDLVLHFKTQETGIQYDDTEVVLIGETFDGQAIEGSDFIKIVGSK